MSQRQKWWQKKYRERGKKQKLNVGAGLGQRWPRQTLGTWHFLMLLVAMSECSSSSSSSYGHSCRCRDGRADLQTMHMAVNTLHATWPLPATTTASYYCSFSCSCCQPLKFTALRHFIWPASCRRKSWCRCRCCSGRKHFRNVTKKKEVNKKKTSRNIAVGCYWLRDARLQSNRRSS